MMKAKSCVVLSILILFSGCLQTRNDIRETEGKKAAQESVNSMQRAAADQASRYQEVEASARELNGRVDVLENKINVVDASHNRQQKEIEDQLSESNKKVALLQEEIVKIQQQMNSLADQVSAAELASSQHTREEKSSAKADKKNTFDIAEELFKKKEWRKAILNYQKYRDSFPKGKKVLESTYKIGVSFQELGMKEEAKSFYEELIAKSPKSDEARRAKIRLKKLK